jgi:hypothetical protein
VGSDNVKVIWVGTFIQIFGSPEILTVKLQGGGGGGVGDGKGSKQQQLQQLQTLLQL